MAPGPIDPALFCSVPLESGKVDIQLAVGLFGGLP